MHQQWLNQQGDNPWRRQRAWKKWNRWEQQQHQQQQNNHGQQWQQQFGAQHPWQQWCSGRGHQQNEDVIASNIGKCGSEQHEKNKKIKVMAEFVSDVTLPDRSYYPTDTVLTKTWKMRNNGENEWGVAVELVFFKGNESLTLEKRYPVINAQSGQEVEVSAVIKTPKKPGRYCSYYRLQRNGEYFGPRVWVDIFACDEQDTLSMNRSKNQKKWKKKKQEKKKQKMEKKKKKKKK